MKTLRAMLISFVIVTLAVAQSPTSTSSGTPEIVLDRASADIFPESWRDSRVNAKAELLAPEDRERAKSIVDAALEKYPAALLSANLKTVYVVGGLEYFGVSTGGTNSRNAVYVVSGRKFSTADLERIFHAEFSSILLRNFPDSLDQAAWRQINLADFKYRGSGAQAVKDKQVSVALRDDLHSQGFLNEYAQASLEEDFNSFAGRLFLGDAKLWSVIEKHPKVRAKSELVIAFFEKCDVSLTRDYFRSLRPAP